MSKGGGGGTLRQFPMQTTREEYSEAIIKFYPRKELGHKYEWRLMTACFQENRNIFRLYFVIGLLRSVSLRDAPHK